MSELERLTFQGQGVTLVADALGPADGLPILFLHGSGQTRQSWGKALEVAARRGYRGISLELRGHGESDWAPAGDYRLDSFVADIRAVIDQIGRPPVVVGASLGGLVALLLAAEQPDAMRALVLVDITARIEREGSQHVIDFMNSGQEGFASLEEAADAVAAYLPHRERPKDTSGLARNLRLKDGRYVWHWDPAFMRISEDPDTMTRTPIRLKAAARSLAIPTLLIRGGRSRIVTEEGAREFLELVPHAAYVDIAGADHMVAGDENDAFNDAVFAFIAHEAVPAASAA